jgi:soluble lytic murein transglycosylase-like protein
MAHNLTALNLAPLHLDDKKTEIAKTAIKIAEEEGVPAKYVIAIIYHESEFNQSMYSGNNDGSVDVGLMQLNSNNREEFAKLFNDGVPYNPLLVEDNIRIGVRYLKDHFKTFHTWELAFRAYNVGYARAHRSKTGKRYAAHIWHTVKIINGGKY